GWRPGRSWWTGAGRTRPVRRRTPRRAGGRSAHGPSTCPWRAASRRRVRSRRASPPGCDAEDPRACPRSCECQAAALPARTSGCGSLPAQKGGRLLIRRVVGCLPISSAVFATPNVACMTPRDDSESSPSRWSDLDRPPLDATSLRRGLVREGGLWRAVDVVQRTGATDTDLAARAADGPADEGTAPVAAEQAAARGRLARQGAAPPRPGLCVAVALRTAAAVASGPSRPAGVGAARQWPIGLRGTVGGQERKAGGILAERAGDDAVVIGVGVNVTLRAGELPVPQAGSLTLAGAVSTDRDPLLRGVLRSLEDWYGRWRGAGGDAAACGLQETYAAGCATLGRMVRAELPGDRSVVGEAMAVDGDGRLVLATGAGLQEPVGAGDIVHLRPAGGA